MKLSELLYYLCLPLALAATRDNSLVSNFRQFLETALQEASANLSATYGIPDTRQKLAKGSDGWVSLSLGYLDNMENMTRDGDCSVTRTGAQVTATAGVSIDYLQYSYDFSANSRAYQDASGCVYGEIQSVEGTLTIQANLSNPSAVTAVAQDFKFHGLGTFVLDEASITDLDSTNFVNEASIATGNLLRREAMPTVETQIVHMMNGLLNKMTFDMSSISSVSKVTGRRQETSSTYLRYTNITTSKKQSTVNKSNPKHSYVVRETSAKPFEKNSYGSRVINEHNNFAYPPKSKGTNRISLVPRDITQTESREGLSCRLTRAAAHDTLNSSRRTSHEKTMPERSTNIEASVVDEDGSLEVKNSLTNNFNSLVDKLLGKTDSQFISQNLVPYRLPDGEVELYQMTDGSVKFTHGKAMGMNAMELVSDPTVEINGHTASVSVDVNFANITLSLSYLANSNRFTNVTASVLGNITRLRGQLTIAANLADASAVRAEFKDFQWLPTALLSSDFSLNVHHPKIVNAEFIAEISDAVVSDFKDSVGGRLQDRATSILRRAVALVRQDMQDTLGTTRTTSRTTRTTARSTTTSRRPTSSPTRTASTTKTASTSTSHPRPPRTSAPSTLTTRHPTTPHSHTTTHSTATTQAPNSSWSTSADTTWSAIISALMTLALVRTC